MRSSRKEKSDIRQIQDHGEEWSKGRSEGPIIVRIFHRFSQITAHLVRICVNPRNLRMFPFFPFDWNRIMHAGRSGPCS